MHTCWGVSIIGSGTVSDLHVRALQRQNNVTLQGVYSLNYEQAAIKAQGWGCRVYARLEELLADTGVDVVIIASPVEVHVEQAERALRAGKHVLIEKPVALHSNEVSDLIRLSDACGKVCCPGYNYIYDYEIARMQDFILSDRAGSIASFWMIYNLCHPVSVLDAYPGAMRQIMTHHLYVAFFLLGTPDWISANTSKIRDTEREDQALITLEYANGTLAHLFCSMAVDDETSSPWSVLFKVLGTKGGATFSWRDYIGMEQSSNLGHRFYLYEDSFYEQQVCFFKHLQDGGSSRLRSTLKDAVLVAYALELAEQSVATRAAQRFKPGEREVLKRED